MAYKIFLNYRREDLDGTAERIQQKLEILFGKQSIFLDKDVRYGDPWPPRIKEALHASQILLALIGPKWFEVKDEYGRRRIDSSKDWVRCEIEEAMEKGLLIIPVIFGNSKQFEAEAAYPEGSGLVNLKNLKKIDLRQDYFDYDVKILLDRLEEVLGPIPDRAQKINQATHFDPLRDLPLPKDLADKLPEEGAPYIGLRPFERKDAALFYGRGQEILELYNKIEAHRVTLLYGFSGVGKSSLLFAGLFPRIMNRLPIEYIRRDRSAGLAVQLAQALRLHGALSRPCLLMLDQAEEMFTAPNPDNPLEAENFAKELSHAEEQFPNLRFIIGFRSDYYVQFEELLKPYWLRKGEYLLNPLGRQGIEEAITGVVKSKLNDTYKVELKDIIVRRIIEELSKDVSSSVGPLLQVQLRLLWDAGVQRKRTPYDKVVFDTDLLDAHFNKNLNAFLDTQLKKMEKTGWKQALEMGLVLDVLHYYTTESHTADGHADNDTSARYPQADIANLLIELKKYYLLASDPASVQPSTRLAHDALAPVVRERFNDSNLPAQQAWRIVETKRRDPGANFSDSDIRAIKLGKPFMPILEAELIQKMEEDEAALERKEKTLKDNQDFIFQRLCDDATQAIYSLDHAPAIDKFNIALRFDYDLNAKCNHLLDGLLELLFFFNEAGQWDKMQEIIPLLLPLLSDGENTTAALHQCRQVNDAGPVRLFMQDHYADQYRVFYERYYPVMIVVQGGQYEMGGGDYGDNKTAHPVAVNGFKIARTPCTFYQYSLYCAASGKAKISAHSPPWGRWGNHPVVLVQWYQAIEYAQWLSEKWARQPAYHIPPGAVDDNNHNRYDSMKWEVEKLATDGFRLPTEAEWEWAASGGEKSGGFLFAGSNIASEVAWGKENSPEGTQPVAQLAANELGLYDMCGNAWEWCWDWYDAAYYERCKEQGLLENPGGPPAGEFRAIRGGSHYENLYVCKNTVRSRINPSNRNVNVSFRLSQDL